MDKIIEHFIKEPEREFYVREFSKLLKKSPTTISKYLKKYEKEGILTSKESLNHLFFKANSTSRMFKSIKLSYNLNQLYKLGLVDYLEGKFNHPKAIILFGSFAKAEDAKNSDIDLLIVSSNKDEPDLEKFEKKIGKSIQLHIYSEKDIELMKVKNKGLLNNLINGILLSGYLELFR
jgi:predicted nucleotidyltransferase